MKNNWIDDEVATRTKMNQPMVLASGWVAGTTMNVRVSAGRMRYPYDELTLNYSYDRMIAMANAPAGTFQTFYQRRNGDIVTSGHTTLAATPKPPYADSEFLGVVYTGASLSTANLVGPWNMAASGHNELRGEYYAMTPLRPRIATSGTTGRAVVAFGDSPLSAIGSIVSVGWSTPTALVSAQVYEPPGTSAFLTSTVTYVASGYIAADPYGLTPSGVLRVKPTFYVSNGAVDPILAIGKATHEFLLPQNPDGGDDLVGSHTITICGAAAIESPTAGRTTSYTLYTLCDPAGAIRITDFNLSVIPGYKVFGYADDK